MTNFVIDYSELPIKHDTQQNGRYEYLNGSFIAVFSYINKNYLFLNGTAIQITDDIRIEHSCGERKDVKSRLSIYEKENTLLAIEYESPIEPLIDPSSGIEDWEVLDLGHHLLNYINQVKKNPELILF